jgi:hypothetical protein
MAPFDAVTTAAPVGVPTCCRTPRAGKRFRSVVRSGRPLLDQWRGRRITSPGAALDRRLGRQRRAWSTADLVAEAVQSLLLGEVPRLRDDADGYGPRGRNLIDHVDIPEQVLLAYRNLAGQRPDLIRPAGGRGWRSTTVR